MAIVKPFRALRPTPAQVAAVASVPYDVVNTAEARALAHGNPLSLLHVSRPEIDLPEGTDIHADAVYAKGRENLQRLIREAPLTVDEAAAYYVYRLTMDGRSQTGIVGVAAVDDYDGNVVRKHEKTRADKEDDRTRHILTLRAQTGPVFLTYRDAPSIDALVSKATEAKPLYAFDAPDGVSHTCWRVHAPQAIAAIEKELARVERTYVADGHHRAASASRARRTLAREVSRPTGQEAFNYFLAVLFPASHLKIMPYNRVVKDLGRRTAEDFLRDLRVRMPVAGGAPDAPFRRGHVSMYLAGHWYDLTLPAARPGAGPAALLDVARLQEEVLAPLLSIGDPRTDKRIDFVGGIRGTGELVRLIDEGHWAVAFSMHPVSIDDLMAIADRGELMPPKSTWFEPKLRSGLVIHQI